MALIDAQASVEQFSEHKIRQADVVALAQRVEIEIDPEIDRNYPEIYGGQVTIEFIDGTKQTRRVDYSLGMPENPVSLESVSNKFRSLVNAVSVDISGEELLGSVLKPFERGSLCPLYAKLRDLKIKPLKVNEF